MIGTDSDDNELNSLEIIHHFVEVLDRYFGNVWLSSPFDALVNLFKQVCELDLIFNFHKVCLRFSDQPFFSTILYFQFVSKFFPSPSLGPNLLFNVSALFVLFVCILFVQAYYILDELIIAGELQESSKKAVLRVCAAQDALMEENKDSKSDEGEALFGSFCFKGCLVAR